LRLRLNQVHLILNHSLSPNPNLKGSGRKISGLGKIQIYPPSLIKSPN